MKLLTAIVLTAFTALTGCASNPQSSPTSATATNQVDAARIEGILNLYTVDIKAFSDASLICKNQVINYGRKGLQNPSCIYLYKKNNEVLFNYISGEVFRSIPALNIVLRKEGIDGWRHTQIRQLSNVTESKMYISSRLK